MTADRESLALDHTFSRSCCIFMHFYYLGYRLGDRNVQSSFHRNIQIVRRRVRTAASVTRSLCLRGRRLQLLIAVRSQMCHARFTQTGTTYSSILHRSTSKAYIARSQHHYGVGESAFLLCLHFVGGKSAGRAISIDSWRVKTMGRTWCISLG